MKTTTILEANKWFLSLLFVFGTYFTLNAQVQDSLTINTGNVASAIGLETQATGDYSLATGYQSIASGNTSSAFGISAKAIGNCSFSFGNNPSATGENSIALGYYATTTNDNSLSVGYQSFADGLQSFAIGQNSYAKSQAYAFGYGAIANCNQTIAIGKFVETRSSGAIVIGSSVNGYSLINDIPNSLMVGFNSTVPTFFVGPSANLNSIGKVGIGTAEPKARLQVADGDIFIQDINKGIIMKSPDGSCWRGTVNNAGQLEFVKLTDCENLTTKSNEGTGINTIKVFPNPSNEYFEVNCTVADCQKYNTISFFGTTGNLVFSQPLTSGSTRISTKSFASGSYILKLHGAKDSFTDIVVVTH